MVKSLVVSRVSQLKQHGECTVILRSTNMPLYKLKISLGTKNKGPDLLGGKKTHTKKTLEGLRRRGEKSVAKLFDTYRMYS